jgi:methylated-DNA-protein-cysteine methyltransferase-like protein
MANRTRSSPDATPLRAAMEAVVSKLKTGEVISYGEVAARAGRPGAARAAGTVLAQSADTLPWWRVVYGDGHLPACNPGLQAERLAEEGVELKGFRVIYSPLGRFAKRVR